MSLKAVDGILSSLKSCQTDIVTGMDIVTDVAMDLAEAQGKYHKLFVSYSWDLGLFEQFPAFFLCV